MVVNEITLLVWDNKDNFELPSTKRQFGIYGKSSLYKKVFQFYSEEEFNLVWTQLDDNDNLVFCCHIDYKSFNTFWDFRNSNIKDDYKIPDVVYLSSADSGKVMHELFDKFKISEKIILYNELLTRLKIDEIKPFNKKGLHNDIKSKDLLTSIVYKQSYPKIDYAIITALYENEFEEIANIIDFKKENSIETKNKVYHIGCLKSDMSKKIVAAIPNATGMVDSAIIACQIVDFFKPDYLLMSGVCGGRKDLNIGDIILASQVYMFQKGKLSDYKITSENNEAIKAELFDKDGKPIDIEHLYDENGNQILVRVEKFEIEHDSVINIDSLFKDRFEPRRKAIQTEINSIIGSNEKEIQIIFEPMACSSMVINKNGFFDDYIKSVNRKTAAVEMESYGVARACEFANDGKTKCIIFKSVMDNTYLKNDSGKSFAARTSSLFLQQLFSNGII